MYRITLKTPFVTLNEYIEAERTSRFIAANMKRKIENNICLIAKAAKFKLPENKTFDVEIIWFTPNNKTDHDNISFAKKFIFDGLQKAKSLQNDSPKYIRNFCEKFLVNKSVNFIHCVITFKEIEL